MTGVGHALLVSLVAVFALRASIAALDETETTMHAAGGQNEPHRQLLASKQVRRCPFATGCATMSCNPCPDLNPTVYLATGNGANPPNALWIIRNFSVGNMSLVPEFVCALPAGSPQFGDIAVMHWGDLVYLDVAGKLRYIPAASMPSPTTDFTVKCPTPIDISFKFDAQNAGFSGLSNSFKSDVLIASTGNGWVVPLKLKADATAQMSADRADAGGLQTNIPAYFACWYTNSSNTSGIANSGGTDVTAGPDGAYYRWCAKDQFMNGGMNFTGTRFPTVLTGSVISLASNAYGGDSPSFVINTLSDAVWTKGSGPLPYANAGSFCTSKHVIGVATWSPANNPEAGSQAVFYTFGVANGQSMRGMNINGRASLPAATLAAQTIKVLNPNGSVRRDALRVVGAAVKGDCSCGSNCVDINACVSTSCHPSATSCTDLPPPAGSDASGRVCDCSNGFSYVNDTVGCVDTINACTTSPCHASATSCTDLPPPAGADASGRVCSCAGGSVYVNDTAGCCGVGMSLANYHTCVIAADSTVKCFGQNTNGQLGTGGYTTTATPQTVSGLIGAISVSTGWAHTCAVVSNGTVWCWGLNSNGQIGQPVSTSRSLVPVQVPGITTAVSVSAGQAHSCAVLKDGTARCWGANSNGGLGNGNKTSSPTPVQVSGLSQIQKISAGYYCTCAVVRNGTAYCWGSNGNGSVGDGTSGTDRALPVAVMNLTGVADIDTSVMGTFTCAVLTDGTARCWGGNNNGRLGDNTTTNSLVPVVVRTLTGAAQVSCGYMHTCATLKTGQVACWGLNGSGQLGLPMTTAVSLVPVVVPTITAAKVEAGFGGTSAATAGGSVSCWGSPTNSALGDGTASWTTQCS